MGIWAKIGGALKTGAKTTKDVLLLVPKALIYPIKKPFAPMSEAKHDAKVSLKGAVGIDVPEEEKKYDPPIETTEASEYLSIQITKQGKGKVSFLASRTLTGDVPHLSPEKLDKIRKNLPNITVFREENKIVIEVDVEGIIQEIKDKNPGMDEKAAKRCALEEIYHKIDCDLKNLAKVTDGEFKVHTDRKLLYGIAEKLYREYDNQKQSSEEVMVSNQSSETLASLPASDKGKVLKAAEVPIGGSEGELSKETAGWQSKTEQGAKKIEERHHSLTVPGDMYHLQPEVITARRANGIETFLKRQQMDYGSVLRGQDIQLKDVSSLEDVSSKAVVSSPSTPNYRQNRRGPGV